MPEEITLKKPPFDPRKITAAVVLSMGMISAAWAFLFEPEAHLKPVQESEYTQTQAVAELEPESLVQGELPSGEAEQAPVGVAEPTEEPQLAVLEEAEPLPTETAFEPDPRLKRVVLTYGIEARNPIDDLQHRIEARGEFTQIYLFTQIKQMQGQEVLHKWYYNDKLKAEVSLKIGSPMWRTYSSKRIRKDWTGTWRVEVTDKYQEVLAEKTFEFVLPDSVEGQ